jgi:hypothetical protein
MIEKYKEFYIKNFTHKRYKKYQHDFETEVGKLYALATGPYFLKQENATMLQQKVLPALMSLLKQTSYQEQVYTRGWFLPVVPIKKEDFFGSADFHVDGDQMKLIELNFFLPGHFGLIELFPKLFSKNFDLEFEIFTDGFEVKLAKFLKQRFQGENIALCVNHLTRSQHYFEHYKYIEHFLKHNGINAKVVYAKDAEISSNNKPMWNGDEYDGVFNMVIPRNWEHHQEEFLNYTTLFTKIPEMFFPNPWCWTIGDKRFLNVLSDLKHNNYGLSQAEIDVLQSITLKSKMLNRFSNPQELISFFGPDKNFVLKPIDNYHTQGVYLNPSDALIRKIMEEEADSYIAQESFEAERLYYEDENKNSVTPWRGQLRVEFFNGEFLNFRAYGFSDPFGLSPMMPVVVT